MPLISVRATPGAFNADSKARLVRAITDAGCVAESMPDSHRRRTIVLWEELSEVFLGGEPAESLARVLLLTFTASDGVLDPVRREQFSKIVHDAAQAEPADERPITTSIVFVDVPEGRWGRDGTVVRLPQMAALAGFEHLKSLHL
jgi:phenylpyruvate tautomerase PptA (4-oxalocrotonate tautomerase family)